MPVLRRITHSPMSVALAVGSKLEAMEDTEWLDIADIAELLGIGVPSARTYHQRARQNERDGQPKPGDMPAPDRHFGRSPAWKSETITEWMQQRPGQGAGGGRPKGS